MIEQVLDVGGDKIRVPLIGIAGPPDGQGETVVVFSRARNTTHKWHYTEGLADAVRLYSAKHGLRIARVVAIMPGRPFIDRALGDDILARVQRGKLSGRRTERLRMLRDGVIEAARESYACGRCEARLLCPAYQLPAQPPMTPPGAEPRTAA